MSKGTYVTTVPGPIFSKVLAREKTGYDYDEIEGLYYVDQNCRVYKIEQGSEGYCYAGDHGMIVRIGRGSNQIIAPSELSALLNR